MENAMALLYDLCRLCLDEPGVDNIFEPVDWSQDIRKFTGVKVIPADQLPQTICNNCRDILNCTKVLREIATTNDKRLQRLRSGDHQVSTPIHVVTITTRRPSDSDQDQNETNEQSDTSTHSEDRSFKNRIIFEDERPNESHKKIKKRHKEKRKLSSSKQDSESGVSKKIAIRADLFNTTETVTSSSSSSLKITVKASKASDNNKVEDRPSSSKPMISSTKIKSSASSSKDGNAIKTEFNHVCETCSKSYSTAKKLYLHHLTHNRKFLCPLDVCEKKFATRNDLQKHIRSHTGEKPFKCNLCDQSFAQNVTLKAHKEKVHNEIVMSQSQH